MAEGLLDRVERVGPAPRPRLHLQQCRQHPGRLGPERESLLRKLQRPRRVAGALGLNEQAAQAEERRRRLIEHRFEIAARSVVVALELRRLGREQERQGRLLQQRIGASRKTAGAFGITRRRGDQPLGQRAIAQPLAAAPARQRNPAWADPDEAHHGGNHQDDGRSHGDGRSQGPRRGLDHVVAPGDLHTAGRLGNPGRGCRHDDHRDDEGDDADHCVPPVVAQRAPMRAWTVATRPASASSAS